MVTVTSSGTPPETDGGSDRTGDRRPADATAAVALIAAGSALKIARQATDPVRVALHGGPRIAAECLDMVARLAAGLLLCAGVIRIPALRRRLRRRAERRADDRPG